MLFKLALLVVYLSAALSQQFPTPLQQYVWAPDTTYRYELVSQVPGQDIITYNIHLFSQTWLTKDVTSISVWDHWLQLIIPKNYDGTTQAGIYVDGNGQSPTPPAAEDIIGVMIAKQTGIPFAHLYQIPNEPAFFSAEGCCKRRSEDSLIAYTWSHYINDTSHPEWLLRCPMVKATVRAMDALEDFLPKIGIKKPEKFVIAGASKRGWTTWLLPAVDTRVNAIVPLVMPILNMRDVINQMWRSLGEWSFALSDYIDMNLMADLNTGGLAKVAEVVDPVVYMKYLAVIPKYMVFSTGDEFFLPDSARNFLDGLQGDYYLRMAPNTDHSLAPLDAIIVNNMATFVLYLKNSHPIPSIKETIIYSNTSATITVVPSQPPTEVRLYQTTTLDNSRRDFRLVICDKIPNCFHPVLWTYSFLQPNSDGSYSATVHAPAPILGWSAFVIELSYKSDYAPVGEMWFQITSRVVIVPDIYPFPSCGLNCGANSTSHSSSHSSSPDLPSHRCSLFSPPSSRPCLPRYLSV